MQTHEIKPHETVVDSNNSVIIYIFSRYNVHNRYRHQLPDHVREQERRGGVGAQQDRVALLPRMVSDRLGGRHTVRSSDRRVVSGNRRGEYQYKNIAILFFNFPRHEQTDNR